ncbi:MAG: type II toxin-antitoxin system HicA family toxin [Candidatus Brocadiaceae bacterium]|nr:type II toxin-antitoxin system HicA family toxin [Candidatus Brocadiaceae bacterium]
MSRLEKLVRRFLSKPKDFTYDELKKLLNGFGYKETKAGKTSGSRVAFINDETGHIIRVHRPHPAHVVKLYVLDLVEETLKQQGLLSLL